MASAAAPVATNKLPTSALKRLWVDSTWQTSRMKEVGLLDVGPYDLAGKSIVVTGGNGGIGFETAKALAAWGAHVTIACRRVDAAQEAKRDMGEVGSGVSVAELDLADLESVKRCADALKAEGRVLDVLCLNAGVNVETFVKSAQGHELCFAVNVLGNLALVQALLENGALSPSARVVLVTGDIYVLASDCTSDYDKGGSQPYPRSKLGTVWFTQQLQERHPELTVVTVHPGVIDTNLFTGNAVLRWVKRTFFLDTAQGAKTTLFACADPNVPKGKYLLNTWGYGELDEADMGADKSRAKAFYDHCQSLL